jgi:Ca2+-binding RTX toxin-like protein
MTCSAAIAEATPCPAARAIDSLGGGSGTDRLTGGSDADRFSGGSGTDTATDFTAAEGDTSDGTIP